MNIEQEIRNEIDNIKQLKIDVGDINNHLSILEGLCRERNQKAVENAYQRGLDDGKAQDSHGCEGCEWDGTPFDVCSKCRNSYGNLYKRKESDDEIKVGDEVIYNEHKFIVFATETEECYASLFDVNGRHASASQRECKKTGRHVGITDMLKGALE